MRLVCERLEHLPTLAWCAEMSRKGDSVRVIHGPGVESRGTFFFEGAWAGPFQEGGFADAVACFGSGGTISRDKCLFVAPTHTLDHLYLIAGDDRLFLSNSLAFVLVRSGEKLDTTYQHFVRDWYGLMIAGLDAQDPSFPTASGGRVRVFHHCNLRIGDDLEVLVEAKRLPPAPAGYDEYYQLLNSVVAQVGANAMSVERAKRYTPISTLSSGYDSPAATVLAQVIGCTEALTIPNPRRDTLWAHDADDSGVPVAKALGLSIKEIDRDAYLQRDNLTEAEFLACGGMDDIILVGMESDLAGRTLFTGVHGDSAWTMKSKMVNNRLGRSSVTDVTMGEFRLRVGFIHVPIAFVGAAGDGAMALYKISTSEEMKPWSVGGEYDRTIPRRIVESRGVPRDLFGRHKMAASVQHALDGMNLKAFLSPVSLQSYRQWRRTFPFLRRQIDTVRAYWIRLNTRIRVQSWFAAQWIVRKCSGRTVVWRLGEWIKRTRISRYQIPTNAQLAVMPPGDSLLKPN